MDKNGCCILIENLRLMAEIQTSGTGKNKGVRRSKKLSTKVDLTPMVDLGFLLITFFVFTTSIAKPTAMKIAIPEKGEGGEVAAGKTLNVLLAANNTIYYYFGDSMNNMHTTNFSPVGLREIIRSKKTEVQKKYGDANETVVLIKPTPEASYSNIVNALDEIQINTIKRYVLMDADEMASLFKH
jgi:biopolymer transport protein ExbD